MKFNILKSLSILIIFIPIFFYFLFFEKYFINIPFGDDLYVFTDFIINYSKSSSISEIISSFFYTEKEHINVIPRFFLLLEYHILNEINFKTFAFLGNSLSFFLLLLSKI